MNVEASGKLSTVQCKEKWEWVQEIEKNEKWKVISC